MTNCFVGSVTRNWIGEFGKISQLTPSPQNILRQWQSSKRKTVSGPFYSNFNEILIPSCN